MTAEAPSPAASPDPRPVPATAAHPARRHQPNGNATRSSRASARTGAAPVLTDQVVTDLVTRARNGDKQAWDALIERYVPLIWSICRRHGLGRADAEQVGQNVWQYLANQLERVRDPAALPGWLATAARQECLRVLHEARRPQAAGQILDTDISPDEQARGVEQQLLLAERHATLREAFLTLPPNSQQLISLLLEEPPVSHAEISARLGIPVGSIGPDRHHALSKLRRHPAIAALITPAAETA